MILQSLTVARYIANKYGLDGRDDMEAARDQLYKIGFSGKWILGDYREV